MGKVDEAIIAKLKKGGKTYEVLVDAEKAQDFKAGKCSIEDAVITEEIFYDAKKGDKASENELKRIFETDDKFEVCKIILTEGVVPKTSEMKREELEVKRKQIIYIIHRNAVDPKTGKPHPMNRIDNAISEAKIRIDEHRTSEEQLDEVIKGLRIILPLKIETRQIQITLPANCAGKSYSTLKKYGKMVSDSWKNDGSMVALIEIPAGIQEELEKELNDLSKGSVEIKIMNTR